jgi:nitrogen-specific signal transduction histidine kinase
MFVASSVVRSTQRNSRSLLSKRSKRTTKRQKSVFLSTVPDSLVGGVLIVAESGEVVYANPKARDFCRQLSSHSSQPETIPEIVWHLCQSLIESQDLFPDRNLILESEVESDGSGRLHLQVRHFEFDRGDRSYLLVTLDECSVNIDR